MNRLKKIIEALRARLGWDDVDRRMSPAHGWLLPAVVRPARVDALGRAAAGRGRSGARG